jgi:putative membrane protein
MYVSQKFSLKSLFRAIWWLLLATLAYSVTVYYLTTIEEIQEIHVPLVVTTVLGTAISLLLGFRTNAAYERWWEARKIWGSIVNDSRTLVRQFKGYLDQNDPTQKVMIDDVVRIQIAWVHALKNHLRREGIKSEIKKYLSEEENDQLEKCENIPNALLDLMHAKLQLCLKNGWIDSIQQSRIDTTIANLCDSMGRCERIKNTVFPIQYTSYTLLSVAVFALIFPLSIVKQEGIYVIPITFLVVFVFLLIGRIASYMQNPFDNLKSDTPMSSIARTIEINLLQQVGAENIPDKLEPRDGVLM